MGVPASQSCLSRRLQHHCSRGRLRRSRRGNKTRAPCLALGADLSRSTRSFLPTARPSSGSRRCCLRSSCSRPLPEAFPPPLPLTSLASDLTLPSGSMNIASIWLFATETKSSASASMRSNEINRCRSSFRLTATFPCEPPQHRASGRGCMAVRQAKRLVHSQNNGGTASFSCCALSMVISLPPLIERLPKCCSARAGSSESPGRPRRCATAPSAW